MSSKGFTVVLSARIDQYRAAMEAAKGATKGFSDDVTSKMSKSGEDFKQVGSKLTRNLTLPIVAVGTAAVAMAGTFETAFAQMVGLAGVAADDVDGLKKSVLALSGETAVAPQELADALYFAASAGLDTAGAMKAVEIAARASAAGMGSASEIVGLVASAIASYGDANIDAAQATDILTSTIRAGRADPAELAGTLGRILPVASSLGLTFDEVGGAVAYLSNVFGDTNRTVTALSGFMVKLVSPTQQGRDALLDMGTSVAELHAAIDQNGLMGALDLLRSKGFAGNQQALRALFDDIEGFQGALALLNDESGSLVGVLDEVKNSTGSLGTAFSAVADTDAFAAKQSWTEVKVAMIEAGEQLLPMVASLAAFVGDLASAFGNLDPAAQSAILGAIAFAAALGPLLTVIGNVQIALGGLTSFVAAHPLLAAAAAVGAIAGALFLFGNENSNLGERTTTVASALGEQVDRVVDLARETRIATSATAGFTLAQEALSNALTGGDEQGKKTKAALGALGFQVEDAADAMTLLKNAGAEFEQGLIEKPTLDAAAAMFELQGHTAEVAVVLAEAAAGASFMGDAADVTRGKTKGWTVEMLAAFDAAIALGQAAGDVDVAAISAEYLNAESATSKYREQLVTLAEITSGASRSGAEANLVYAEYTRILTGLTPEQLALYEGTVAAVAATEELGGAVQTTGDKLTAAADAAKGLRNAIDAVFSPTVNLEEATRALFAGVDDLAANFNKLDENGNKLSNTLDIATARGRENRAEIQGRIEQILAWAVANAGVTGSVEEIAAQVEFLTGGLYDQLKAAGLTQEQIDEYLTTLGLTPENIRTSIELAGVAAAEAQLRNLARPRTSLITASVGSNNYSSEGRLVTSPMVTNVGEGSKAEVILPLTKPGRMRDLLAHPGVGPLVADALYAGGGNLAPATGHTTASSSPSTSASESGGGTTTINFLVGDEIVQSFTVRQDQLKRGAR